MDIKLKAVITNEDGVFYAGIPDVTTFDDGTTDFYATFGNTIDEVLNNIKDVAILKFNDSIQNKIDIIQKQYDIILNANQQLTYLCFNLEYELSKVKNKLKNKTVVLPVWLDILATEHKLNFSQILQKALKKELNI